MASSERLLAEHAAISTRRPRERPSGGVQTAREPRSRAVAAAAVVDTRHRARVPIYAPPQFAPEELYRADLAPEVLPEEYTAGRPAGDARRAHAGAAAGGTARRGRGGDGRGGDLGHSLAFLPRDVDLDASSDFVLTMNSRDAAVNYVHGVWKSAPAALPPVAASQRLPKRTRYPPSDTVRNRSALPAFAIPEKYLDMDETSDEEYDHYDDASLMSMHSPDGALLHVGDEPRVLSRNTSALENARHALRGPMFSPTAGIGRDALPRRGGHSPAVSSARSSRQSLRSRSRQLSRQHTRSRQMILDEERDAAERAEMERRAREADEEAALAVDPRLAIVRRHIRNWRSHASTVKAVVEKGRHGQRCAPGELTAATNSIEQLCHLFLQASDTATMDGMGRRIRHRFERHSVIFVAYVPPLRGVNVVHSYALALKMRELLADTLGQFSTATLVKTDNRMAVVTFDRAQHAVEAAFLLTEFAATYNKGKMNENEHVDVRVGMDCGRVLIVPNDVYGTPVNLAVRLATRECSSARPIYMSSAMHSVVLRGTDLDGSSGGVPTSAFWRWVYFNPEYVPASGNANARTVVHEGQLRSDAPTVRALLTSFQHMVMKPRMLVRHTKLATMVRSFLEPGADVAHVAREVLGRYAHERVVLVTDLHGFAQTIVQEPRDRGLNVFLSLLFETRELMRGIVARQHGIVAKYVGPVSFCVFERPIEAIEAALEINSTVDGFNAERRGNHRIRIAMAIDEGALIHAIEDEEVLGTPVDRALDMVDVLADGLVGLSRGVKSQIDASHMRVRFAFTEARTKDNDKFFTVAPDAAHQNLVRRASELNLQIARSRSNTIAGESPPVPHNIVISTDGGDGDGDDGASAVSARSSSGSIGGKEKGPLRADMRRPSAGDGAGGLMFGNRRLRSLSSSSLAKHSPLAAASRTADDVREAAKPRGRTRAGSKGQGQ